MKKTLLYALCGLTLLQAMPASAFNITQTWHNLNPTYKKWIKVMGWTALAAGAAYVTYRGASYIKSELNRSKELSAKAEALHKQLLPEFTQKVQEQELSCIRIAKNKNQVFTQEDINKRYLDLQKNRALLNDIVNGKEYFPEVKNLYLQNSFYDTAHILVVELLCLAASIPAALYGAYDAFMKPAESNNAKPSSEWHEIKLNTPIPFDDVFTLSDLEYFQKQHQLHNSTHDQCT